MQPLPPELTSAFGLGGAAREVALSGCAELSFGVPVASNDGDLALSGAELRLAAGCWRTRGGRVVMQPRGEHVVVYKVAGASRVSYRLGGRTHQLAPRSGACSVIPSGAEVALDLAGHEEKLHLYVDERAVRRFVDLHPGEGYSDRLQPTLGSDDPWLRAYFGMLQSETLDADLRATTTDPGRIGRCQLFLSESEHLLLRHLLRRYPAIGSQAPAPSRPSRVSPLRPHLLTRVVDFIETRVDDTVTLQQLAGLVHMSPDHFLRAFHAATGLTPCKYAQHRRLEAAARLLLQADLSVGDVARRVGFRSSSHFAVQFRAHFGTTPQQYRTDQVVLLPRSH